MIGFHPQSGNSRLRAMRGSAFWIAVCLVLIALFAFVQVAHLHLNSDDADHCALCLTLHSAIPLAIVAMAIVLIALQAPVQLAEQRIPLSRTVSRLYCRPPPRNR